MAKEKGKDETPIFDFDLKENKIFRGHLLTETPENFLFEDEEGNETTLTKTQALNKSMDALVNGVKVRDMDCLIEIEFLGETTKGGEQYQKFKVSVET